MANQLNTTVVLTAQEGQSVTITGPNGQQVMVSGPGGQVTITFASPAVNVIPLDEVVEQEVEPLPLPEVVMEHPVPVVEFRQWRDAQPGSFFYRIDMMANAGKQLSSQFSNAELEDLVSLKMMNVNTFNRTFVRLNLSAQASRNVQLRIRRLMNPELRREANKKSLERYHRVRRERMAAAMA